MECWSRGILRFAAHLQGRDLFLRSQLKGSRRECRTSSAGFALPSVDWGIWRGGALLHHRRRLVQTGDATGVGGCSDAYFVRTRWSELSIYN